MGIVDFSRTRKCKIIVWSMVGAGVLFFIIGIMFNLARPTQISASSMSLNADNKIFDNDVYYLDIYQAQTPIQINSQPLTSNAPIVLSVREGSDYVKVTPQIKNGGFAVIELKPTQSNVFAYGQKATIEVACGILRMTIKVTIFLPKEHGLIESFLMRGNSFSEKLYLSNYGNNSYRLYSYLSILGQIINNHSGFRESEIANVQSGIKLFDSAGYISLPEHCTAGDYLFKIECTFQGQTFSTFYTLTVV